MIAQKLYNNFKQFRIYDLSDHKVNNQHLLVSSGGGTEECGARAWNGSWEEPKSGV